ncbi:hypothetical protein OEA41_001021 [Lepraria neglecta]|uniref:Secreted protein n=1 Tax=Lepraria neglecta TaxID=209136 RepID=A0AAE0DPZ9_9LECA|nr:hypothetical protein OEA41_001021 [Lepraria neglecta]
MVVPFVLIKLLSVAQVVEEEEAPMVVAVVATTKVAEEAMEEAEVDMAEAEEATVVDARVVDPTEEEVAAVKKATVAVSTTPEVDNLMAVVEEEVVRAMTSRAVAVEAGGKPVSGLTTARTCARCQRTERNDNMTEQTNSTDDSYRIRCAKFFGSYN